MAWYDSAIFYHMYPLGMLGAEMQNHFGTAERHFGVLNAYLSYLKVLGINAIYIGPLFQSGTHGYDTVDYKLVDSRLGTNEDFREFVEKAHDLGIKVIVDAVFNHTGRDFFAFQDIKAHREGSAYRNWYKGINFYGNSNYNDGFSYESWRGYDILPALNFYEEAVRNYLIDVVRFWVEEFDIDGLRLDCADVLDLDFQKFLRYQTSQMKEDFFLLGEVIHGDYPRWVNGETLHSVTNYELHKSLYSGFNDQNFFEPAHNLKRNINIATKLYTFLENHDVDRIVSKLDNKENLRAIYTALYTLPGHPSLYYGGEFGIEGKKQGGDDSGLRPSIQSAGMEPNTFTSFISDLSRIYKENPVIALGDFRELLLTNRQWVYARAWEDTAVIVALNNDEKAVDLDISLPIQASSAYDLFSGSEVKVQVNSIHFTVAENSFRLIKVKR